MTIPGWLRPLSAEPTVGACEALAAVDGYQGEFINFFQQTNILVADAPTYARDHVAAMFDVDGDIHVSPATKVRGTFPGVGERLAWMAVATLPPDDARFQRVAIVFFDADSGDLLAMPVANAVSDGPLTCGPAPQTRRELVRQYLPVLLAVAYSGFVALGVTLRRLWLRFRRR